jgi:hypothetical protein
MEVKMSTIHTSSEGAFSGAKLLASSPGKILAILASHAESASQTLSFYDGLNASANLLFRLHLPAGGTPRHLAFQPDYAPSFRLGLYVDAGACNVYVSWIA